MEKHEIGVMTVQEIKEMASRSIEGLDFWTDEKIKETQEKARKHCKKVLKEKPDLYKKGKGID